MRRHVITAAVMVMLAIAARDGSATQQQASGPTPAPEELERLVAPIALYPDQLLAQMLVCATEPQKVAELNKWLTTNAALKGTELQDEATIAGFDPSFVALTRFPQVVGDMAGKLDWTTRLGQAFSANRASVFDAIQRLRTKAQSVGTLKDTPQQDVQTRTSSSGQQVIVIEPANPQIIYVPQYNPQVVYTQPAPTTVVVDDDDDAEEAIAAGLIGFTAGVALGAAFDNDYYYGPYGWHGGVYMFNDGWDDWYDAREDAREDWMDHRENLAEERGDRTRDAREQRTERTDSRQDSRTERTDARQETRSTRTEARQNTGSASAGQAREPRTQGTAGTTTGKTGTTSYQARGHAQTAGSSREASGTRSDAFSGYSSGRSQQAASSRGQQSRSSSRSGGSARSGGSRGGGGRRR
jgi:hypothetical protein